MADKGQEHIISKGGQPHPDYREGGQFRFPAQEFCLAEQFATGIVETSNHPAWEKEAKALLDKACGGDTQALRQVLTPFSVQAGKTAEGARQMRIVEGRKRSTKGLISVIDPVAQTVLSTEHGVSAFFEPSDIDSRTNMVVPKWRVILINDKNEVVTNQKLLDILPVSDKLSPWFERAPEAAPNYLVVSLKTQAR